MKRRAYRDETYWGRPVPGFGDPRARLVVVGLAPGAHGANRTGRMFTGDSAGDFLFAALHRAGFASQAESRARDDGLTLRDAYIVAPVRCVPPDNEPTSDEIARCAPFLDRELALLTEKRALLALGGIGWTATLRAFGAPSPRPKFGHGAVTALGGLALVGCYHPSQQNTQTGRLTPAMIDEVLGTVRSLIELPHVIPIGCVCFSAEVVDDLAKTTYSHMCSLPGATASGRTPAPCRERKSPPPCT